jgi:squalene-hopene/tetraprenyl-beta-curcumene cyclase
LWFGNEQATDDENPVHGTAMVLLGLSHAAEDAGHEMLDRAGRFLLGAQRSDGGWGGAAGVAATIEETANSVSALASCVTAKAGSAEWLSDARHAIMRGSSWLVEHTTNGTQFSPAPIGLYFAKLWYHEKTYPVLWTLAALQAAQEVRRPDESAPPPAVQ